MKVVLKSVRMRYNSLWEATKIGDDPNGKKKFRGTFLFAPDEGKGSYVSVPDPDVVGKSKTLFTGTAAQAMEFAIKAVGKEEWKDQASVVIESLKGNPQKFCFRNGNTKADKDGFAGNLFVAASNEVRPKILDRDGQTPLAQADGRPYNGSYVNAILDVWAFSKFGKSVNAKLLGVQFVKDGDAFMGGTMAEESDFENLSEGEDAPEVSTGTGGFV